MVGLWLGTFGDGRRQWRGSCRHRWLPLRWGWYCFPVGDCQRSGFHWCPVATSARNCLRILTESRQSTARAGWSSGCGLPLPPIDPAQATKIDKQNLCCALRWQLLFSPPICQKKITGKKTKKRKPNISLIRRILLFNVLSPNRRYFYFVIAYAHLILKQIKLTLVWKLFFPSIADSRFFFLFKVFKDSLGFFKDS